MTEFLLVRHGETDWNRDRRFQGHADPGLNDTGRVQALELADELAAERIDAIYASDLARARETAEIIAGRVGAPVVLDRELREIDVGEWQGLTWPEIEQRYPDGVRNWHEHGHGGAIQHGTDRDRAGASKRCRGSFRDLLQLGEFQRHEHRHMVDHGQLGR